MCGWCAEGSFLLSSGPTGGPFVVEAGQAFDTGDDCTDLLVVGCTCIIHEYGGVLAQFVS
jgi:hypothetical protein